jgi:hypothetical protein
MKGEMEKVVLCNAQFGLIVPYFPLFDSMEEITIALNRKKKQWRDGDIS